MIRSIRAYSRLCERIRGPAKLERLRSLVDPSTTAVITMELQQGVVGPDALLPELVQRVAEAETVEAAARVCQAARTVGVACCALHR